MSDGVPLGRSAGSRAASGADDDRLELRLAEYSSAIVPYDRLTSADRRRLADLEARKALRVTEARHGWQITADAVVGVLVLDRVRLVIDPKLAISGDQLIRWLRYALATPVPHQPSLRRWQTSRHGIADLIAAELVAECRELLRGGLRRDYVPRSGVDTVLRGRLDVTSQITRRFGQIDRLHVRTFDRETGIWENELCGAALRVAARITSNEVLARDIATIATQFPDSPRLEPVLRKLDRSRYNRLNSRYRVAHTWSELILRGGGVTDLLADTGQAADSLLLRMSALWEAVVRALVQDVVRPLGGVVTDSSRGQGITMTGDLASRSPFRPDVLVRFGPSSAPAYLPLDAKYKSYDARRVSSRDVHQLLTYVDGYTATGSAAIVYPSEAGAIQRRLDVKGPRGKLGTIAVLGLDVRQAPIDAAEPLRRFLRAAMDQHQS
ncbi:hypothetical protein GCM10009839_78170 [Catenulispora yoronensis]|uniref:5-methylcytosine-specific restriction enzyme subunit McrC n=1 Tax=Catenulispora yoronensis TaxID=450799 RepID=A0ABN2VAU9_9ACTN